MTVLRRRLLISAMLFVGLYAAVLVLLYTQQTRMIYPGSWRGTREWGAIGPAYRLIQSRTTAGLPVRIAYRPARPGMPTILFFHGNGDSIDGSAQAVAPLVTAGYGAVLPEYPGYAGAPGDAGEQNFYAAARAARSWMVANGIAADRTILFGYSIGSGVAMQLAVEQPPRALVLVAPHSGLVPLVSSRFPWVPVDSLLTERFDNLAKIGRVQAPILILHGTTDATIPYRFGERLAAARPDATFVTFPGVGHDIVWQLPAQARILRWIDAVNAQAPTE